MDFEVKAKEYDETFHEICRAYVEYKELYENWDFSDAASKDAIMAKGAYRAMRDLLCIITRCPEWEVEAIAYDEVR